MNTEEFIDFKVLCYLSSNLISHCFYNIWTRRRNAGINNKRDIKKKIAIPKYVLPDVGVVFRFK